MKRVDLRRLSVTFLLLGLVSGLTACSTFNRDWKAATVHLPAPDSLEGPWQGHWRSDASGHNDQLRCLISKIDDSKYQARFHAKYHQVMSFSYTAVLDVSKTNGGYSFQGEADLGKLAGGVYQYAGHSSGTNFFSTYTSKYDHGVFEMGRP